MLAKAQSATFALAPESPGVEQESSGFMVGVEVWHAYATNLLINTIGHTERKL